MEGGGVRRDIGKGSVGEGATGGCPRLFVGFLAFAEGAEVDDGNGDEEESFVVGEQSCRPSPSGSVGPSVGDELLPLTLLLVDERPRVVTPAELVVRVELALLLGSTNIPPGVGAVQVEPFEFENPKRPSGELDDVFLLPGEVVGDDGLE